jgi:hypothetical protein
MHAQERLTAAAPAAAAPSADVGCPPPPAAGVPGVSILNFVTRTGVA